MKLSCMVKSSQYPETNASRGGPNLFSTLFLLDQFWCSTLLKLQKGLFMLTYNNTRFLLYALYFLCMNMRILQYVSEDKKQII